jgi:hypothetical protein
VATRRCVRRRVDCRLRGLLGLHPVRLSDPWAPNSW